MTSKSFQIAVLGLPVTIHAPTLAQARRKLLARYLRALNVRFPALPVTPSLILLAVDGVPVATFS